jgi:hypothetical protein
MKIVISTNMGIITTKISSPITKSAPKDAQVTAGHVHVKPLLGIRKWPWPMAQKKKKEPQRRPANCHPPASDLVEASILQGEIHMFPTQIINFW